MKTPLFAANWKLNKGPKETRDFFKVFKSLVPKELEQQILFFVPATNVEAAAESMQGTQMAWGSQNCYSQSSGAFTGETSAQVVRELGGKFVLLGHSERRQIFAETDAMVAAKGLLVQGMGLIPMLCIGETLQEREAGLTQKVCETQLRAFMQTIDLTKDWVIAYEPVWAIGTGRVATVLQVEETHAQIRAFILQQGGKAQVPILYGGSVKGENAPELLKVPEVDGFLVGGASLEPSSFSKICLAHS